MKDRPPSVWKRRRTGRNPEPTRLPLRERDGLLEADVVCAVCAGRAGRCRAGSVLRGVFIGGLRWGWPAGPARRRTLPACSTVALGGGVFNNRTLLAELPAELRRLGLRPLLPCAMPAGDGSISLGQALWGRLVPRERRRSDAKRGGLLKSPPFLLPMRGIIFSRPSRRRDSRARRGL